MKITAGFCLVLLLLACMTGAGTISIVSGSVPVGQRDPNITVQGMAATILGVSYPAASVSQQQALVIAKHHQWTDISGSQWVGVADGEADSPDNGYHYVTSLYLLAGFRQASITVSATCDNFAEVYLNGNWLALLGGNFWMIYSFGTSNQDFFHSGQNVFEFRVANAPISGETNPSGLVFNANVSYVPEPASALALLAGLGGFIIRRRK